jgi:hypothetical protein
MLPHPCTGRVRAVSVPDSERELKSLKISLKIFPKTPRNACIYRQFTWRRGSESDGKCPFFGQKLQCSPNNFNIILHYSA